MSLEHFALNPDYGAGKFRRAISVRKRQGLVLATIDDTHHAMWLSLEHDGHRILTIEAGIERGPATSCAAAPDALGALIGMQLDASPAEVTARLPQTANCTHLGDLARWAMRAAARPQQSDALHEIVVPDSAGAAPVEISIARNDTEIHRWTVNEQRIVAPAHLAGKPLLKGFLGWARDEFHGDALEAAIMLQRGMWVARGRRYVVDTAPAMPLRRAQGMRDACFSYAGRSWDRAESMIGYVRDFTAGVATHTLPPHISQIWSQDHERQ